MGMPFGWSFDVTCDISENKIFQNATPTVMIVFQPNFYRCSCDSSHKSYILDLRNFKFQLFQIKKKMWKKV